MSFFANQLRAFQGEISSASTKLAQKRTAGATSSSTTTNGRASPAPSNSPGTNKLKRPGETPAQGPLANSTTITYAQPQDSGSGRHLLTQVTYAVEYLKSKDKAIPFSDIYAYLSIQDPDPLSAKRRLERVLRDHSKVDFDPKGFNGKGSFRFRPVHNVRSGDELLAFLQRQPTAQGIAVKELKDGWPGAIDTIEALEREGRLLVTRHKKDNTPRMVWPDDPTLRHPVDVEFQELWAKIKIPVEAADLRKELVDYGLTPTSVVRDTGTKGKMEKKKKRAARKGGKTTNTHMAAILKDYSHTRPVK